MTIDYERTAARVVEQALKFRRDNDALSWDAKIDDLISLLGFSQESYRATPSIANVDWITSAVRDARKPGVKALVSVKHEVILVASDLSLPKVPFAKAHELGHAVLPWHREILTFVCNEFDLTPSAQAELEFEANRFAAEVLVPPQLLAPIYATEPTSLSTVFKIKHLSGASFETSAVAYVRNHPGVCALVWLKDIDPDPNNIVTDETMLLRVTRKQLSNAASKTPLWGFDNSQTIPRGHVVYQASRDMGPPSEVEVTYEAQRYAASVMNNSYSVLCLMSEKK